MPEHYTARRRFTVRQSGGSVAAGELVAGEALVRPTHVGAPLLYGNLRTGGVPHTVNLGLHRLPAVLPRDQTEYWDASGQLAAADADHALPERRLPHAASFVMDTADSPVDRVRVSALSPAFGVRRIVPDHATVVRLQLLAEDPDGALAGQEVRVALFRNDTPLLLSHRSGAADSAAAAQAGPDGSTDASAHAAPFVPLVWQARSNARGEGLQLVEAHVELGHVPSADFVAPPAPGADAVLPELFIQAATAANENFFLPGDHFSVLVLSLADREVSLQGAATLQSLGVRPGSPSAAAPSGFGDFYGGDNVLGDRPRFRFA